MWAVGGHIPSQGMEELEEGMSLPLSGELYVGITLVQLPPAHSEGQRQISLDVKEGCRRKCEGHV